MKLARPIPFVIAAVCASAFAASLVTLALPQKVTAEAVLEEGGSAHGAAIPIRAVRVIVASPYQR